MKPYYADEVVTLHHGDALDVLQTLPDASVDAVVTDPPYGLEFMGKDWDSFKAPGIGGNTAGFGEVRMTDGRTRLARPSYHGSPNPTCRNCGGCQRGREGRSVRKCTCAEPDFPNTVLPRMRAFQDWCEQWAAECLRVLKPGGHLLAFGGTRTVHRLAAGIEDAGFEIRDGIDWLYGSGFPKSLNLGDGRGTALKPAREPIVMARKPLAGTVAANVLAYGTGALNIDATRVEASGRPLREPGGEMTRRDTMGGGALSSSRAVGTTDAGRWPSNVVLSHAPDCTDVCLPGCPIAELDQQSGAVGGSPGHRRNTAAAHNRTGSMGAASADWTSAGFNDSGGASRFFPVFRYEAKATSAERPRVNGVAHPTVKPLDLMRWLVRLVTPTGGTVLEPFAGSGTTAEACVLEGFRCIAIERDQTYLPLITARLTKALQPALDFGAVA